MLQKWKCVTIIKAVTFALVCLMLPAAVFASDVTTTEVSVMGLSAHNNVINAGEPTTISVTTANADNIHVFAMVDNMKIAGLPMSQDAAGNINWEIPIIPSATQTIPVYVNSIDSMEGAIVLSMQITVQSGNAIVSTPAPVSLAAGSGEINNPFNNMASVSAVAIHDVRETRGARPGIVILTVDTSTSVNDVWLQYNDNRYTVGKLDSETGTTKTWKITVYPNRMQNVIISANTSYTTRGAATKQFGISMAGERDESVTHGWASISNVTANRSSLILGDTATFTVTTNAHATHVWADVDGSNVYGTITRDNRNNTTWSIRISPDRTQTVTIYANDADTEEGAASRTRRIAVTESRSSYASSRSSGRSSWDSRYYWGYDYDYYYDYYNRYNPYWYDYPYGYHYDYYDPYYNNQQWGSVTNVSMSHQPQSGTVVFHISTSGNVSRVYINHPNHGGTVNASRNGSNSWIMTVSGLSVSSSRSFTFIPVNSWGSTGNSLTRSFSIN